MSTTLYERGRLTGISGMESVLTLNPASMGPRIKKSVCKMIENAHITGGWASQSRKVAELLAEKFSLSILQTSWNGLTIYAPPTPEIRDKLIELVRADFAAFLLDNPSYARTWYSDQANKTIEALEDGVAKHVDFRSVEFSRQAVALFNTELPESYKQQAKQIVDMLVNNTPIQITTLRA